MVGEWMSLGVKRLAVDYREVCPFDVCNEVAVGATRDDRHLYFRWEAEHWVLALDSLRS